MPIHIQESSKTPNRLDQNRTFSQCIIIKKTTKKQNKHRE
jgi:hypothetical protein